eukprot:04628.XXX_74797_76415_1 [CDS] Oithona nana genome sequencing.
MGVSEEVVNGGGGGHHQSRIDMAAMVDGAIDRIRREVALQREKSNSMCRLQTAHNWSEEKERVDYDDPHISFFWKAHSVSVLIFLICCLIYVGVIEDPNYDDPEFNQRRGIVAALFFWVFAGMTIMPDGPFLRPHPLIWRAAFAVSIVYELLLIYILFQVPKQARAMLKFLDEDLGEPIPEKDYGGTCLIYDPETPNDPYHNVWDKMDIFIFSHLFGYFCKTLIFRDWWLTTVISVMFEFLEYSLEHQLPNFSECWWDHWILDVIVCNGGGTIIGLLTLRYLSLKTYNWRGLYNIPTYRGKIKRIIAQFSPHGWIEFTWNPLSTLERWLAVIGIIFMFLLTELSTFYLKFVLWVSPNHWLNGVRLGFLLLWGAVGLREVFQLLDDPDYNKIGRQSWMLLAVVITEVLVCVKFGWDTITIPLPRHIALWWMAFAGFLLVYTFIKFFIFKPTKLKEPEKDDVVHGSPVRQNSSSESNAKKTQ